MERSAKHALEHRWFTSVLKQVFRLVRTKLEEILECYSLGVTSNTLSDSSSRQSLPLRLAFSLSPLWFPQKLETLSSWEGGVGFELWLTPLVE